MKTIFYNESEGRLRTGWRLLVFFLVLMAINIGLQTGLKLANGGIPAGSEYVRSALLIVMIAISMSVAVPLARKYLDRRSLRSLGVGLDRLTFWHVCAGFLVSAAMALGFLGIAMLLGLASIEGFEWTDGGIAMSSWPDFSASLEQMGAETLAILFLVTVIVSWWEELFFRGYLLQNLKDGLGLMVAVAISCLLYGAVHLTNPNATILSGAIIVIFGLFRIYGYLVSGAIWFSFGAHLGWNFLQGVVLGFNASGNDTASVIQVQQSGPDWLSGGNFGPEGSILVLPILLIAFGLTRWSVSKIGASDQIRRTESHPD